MNLLTIKVIYIYIRHNHSDDHITIVFDGPSFLSGDCRSNSDSLPSFSINVSRNYAESWLTQVLPNWRSISHQIIRDYDIQSFVAPPPEA